MLMYFSKVGVEVYRGYGLVFSDILVDKSIDRAFWLEGLGPLLVGLCHIVQSYECLVVALPR